MSRIANFNNTSETGFWRIMMNRPTRLQALANNYSTQLLRLLGATLTIAILYGCGSGTGVENSPSAGAIINDSCDGASDVQDCQGFRTQVWTTILVVQSCNGCHVENGSGTGAFADSDVLVAYEAVKANNRIDRNDPTNSFLATKVRDNNHNCWVQVAGQVDCVESGNRLASALENWLDPSSAANTNPASGDLGDVASRLENPTVDTPPIADPIVLDQAIQEQINSFQSNIYEPILRVRCSGCHSVSALQAQRQTPYFAQITNPDQPNVVLSIDVDTAFAAIVDNRKIDINDPVNSRIYLRLAQDAHNCWTNCAADAQTMLTAINAMKVDLEAIAPPPLVEGLDESDTNMGAFPASQALALDQGQVISGGQRVTAGQIALWEFKEGTGNVASDSSGVAPQIDLVLNDNADWVGGWGVEFNAGGRATAASIADSQKLHSQIVANNEFTMEAWVVPGNVTQEGPAIIASYSFSETERNFSLGQTLYSYEFLNRNTASGLDVANRANGQPTLITEPNDEDLQATQQHVVMTYDSVNGRRIYVNGQFTGDVDTVTGGTLTDWDPSYVFTLGSDVGGANQWLGKLRMVAIYNRALTDEEITQNFDAGVGQKFHLLFKVGHLSANIPDTSYIWFEVAEFDDYSYVFSSPAFVVLDPDDSSPIAPTSFNLNIQGMSIGVNGKLAPVGQVFTSLNRDIDMPNLTDANNPRYAALIETHPDSKLIDGNPVADIPMSATGTIIAKQRGPNADPPDQFYLAFAEFDGVTGLQSDAGVAGTVSYNYLAADSSLPDASYIAGIRTFEEINATMAELTDIPVDDPAVRPTFLELQQQLPSGPALQGFLSSHQMGMAKLALTYCGALVDDTTKRDEFFNVGGTFDFNQSVANAFTVAGKDIIVDSLYNKMVIVDVSSQPDKSDLQAVLFGPTDGLFDKLSSNCAIEPGCTEDALRTRSIVKAMCVSVLGSAAVTTQ